MEEDVLHGLIKYLGLGVVEGNGDGYDGMNVAQVGANVGESRPIGMNRCAVIIRRGPAERFC
jgi:hypothetical protein